MDDVKPRPLGHFLCCDRWGPPTPAELENGMYCKHTNQRTALIYLVPQIYLSVALSTQAVCCSDRLLVITDHGEAPQVEWTVSASSAGSATMGCDMPMAGTYSREHTCQISSVYPCFWIH